MAGEKYADRAVMKLLALVETNLPTALRAVETAQGLDADSLKDPKAYLSAAVPNDGRMPLIEVICTGSTPIDLLNNLDSHDCLIALSFAGDTNAVNNHKQAYRYMTALVDVVRADRTLNDSSGSVVVAIDGERAFFVTRGSDQGATYAITLEVEVHTHE